MSELIDRLEGRIVRHFERHASRRVGAAALLSGVVSIGVALLVLSFTASIPYTLISFVLVGFVVINLAIFFMVPSVEKLAADRELICGAVRNPSRIKVFDTNQVKLADKDGNVHQLKKFELKLWHSMIVPFLVKQQRNSGGGEKFGLKEEPHTEVAEEELEKRRREVIEAERRIERERKRMEEQYRKIEEKMKELSRAEEHAAELQAKDPEVDSESLERSKKEQEEQIAAREKEIAELRRALEEERADLEERAAYVTTVEESLVDRLNELSSREAEIEQGEINAGIRRD